MEHNVTDAILMQNISQITNEKFEKFETIFTPMNTTQFNSKMREIDKLSKQIQIQMEDFDINNNTEWCYQAAVNDKDCFVIIGYIHTIQLNHRFGLFGVIPQCVIDIIYTYYSFYPMYNVINKIQICTNKICNLENRELPKNGQKLVRKYRDLMAKCGQSMKWIGIVGDEIDEIIANNLPTPSLSDSEIEELAHAYSRILIHDNQTIDCQATNMQYLMDDYCENICNINEKNKLLNNNFRTTCFCYCLVLFALVVILSV